MMLSLILDPPLIASESIKISRFSVMEVPKEEWMTISKTANEWMKFAAEKHESYTETHMSSNSKISYSLLPIERSHHMCKIIFFLISNAFEKYLNQNSNFESWDTVLVCKFDDEIQSIGLHDKYNNQLGYFATHPDNICHPINYKVTTRVKGAGTQLILYLAKESLKSQLTLKLNSTYGAIEFYKKMNFEVSNEYSCEDIKGLTPMKLTVDKIRQLIEDGVAPFDQLGSYT